MISQAINAAYSGTEFWETTPALTVFLCKLKLKKENKIVTESETTWKAVLSLRGLLNINDLW